MMNDDSPLNIPYRGKKELKYIQKHFRKKTGGDKSSYRVLLFSFLVALILLLLFLGPLNSSRDSKRDVHIPYGTIVPVRILEQPTVIPEK